MKSHDDQIHNWQDRLRQSFGTEAKLYEYLFTTLENFFYRYLENNDYKDLKVTELLPGHFGAVSFESSMVEALKIKNKSAHAGILELAKRVPKAQRPMVKFMLYVVPKELTTDQGTVTITSVIDWGFPDFNLPESQVKKEIKFSYNDLAIFRKQLALKIEEACDLFLTN